MIVSCALVAATLAAPSVAVAGLPQRFAVVVGANRAEAGQVPLRFADDEAVRTAEVLREAGVSVELLVRPDADTRRLAAQVALQGDATSANLGAALTRTFEAVRSANAAGQPTEFFFVYSGHGDVEHGEGFVLLDDQRLKRSDLYARVLGASPAGQNHVIIDACRSVLLVFDRGQNSEEVSLPLIFPAPKDPPNADRTGFLLSTSSSLVSHEWELFGGGVFSHELRSALRGGADVNADGTITYAELGAFLERANASVDNPRYRPDFRIRPPASGASTPFLGWPQTSHALAVDVDDVGKFSVEDAQGVRLLDAHPAKGAALKLRLPMRRPLFLRPAPPARADTQRAKPCVAASLDAECEFVLADNATTELSTISPTAANTQMRGALSLALLQLFELPLTPDDADRWQPHTDLAPLGPEGVPPAQQKPPERSVGAAGPDARTVGLFATGVGVVGALVSSGVAYGVGSTAWSAASGASQQQRVDANNVIVASNAVFVVGLVGAGILSAVGAGLVVMESQ